MTTRDWKKELRDYMDRVLSLGFSEVQLCDALKKAGWKDKYTADALRDVLFLRNMRAVRNDQRILTTHAKARAPILRSPTSEDSLEDRRGMHNNIRTMRADHAAVTVHSASPEKKGTPVSRLSHKADQMPLLAPPYFSLPRILLAMPRAARATALFLPAPSFGILMLNKITGYAERIFAVLEQSFHVAMRIVLFPVAIMTLLVKWLSHYRRYDLRPSEVVPPIVASPIVEEKTLPEHVRGWDILRLAGRVFRARRLRTFLTMLGMSVGIGTILFLVSLGYGLEHILFERITNADALLTLDAFAPSDNTVIRIDDALISEIRRIPFVEKTSALTLTSGEIVKEGYAVAGSLYATDADYLRFSGITAEAGTLESITDTNAIISSAAASLLGFGSPEKAIGAQVRFVVSLPFTEEGEEEKTFWLEPSYTVRGVIEDAFSVFAYIPLSALSERGEIFYSQLKIKVDAAAHLNAVRERVLSHGLLVSALSETVDQAEKIFTIAKIVLALFGVITLIVSAIGMFNTMTIALLERTQEVGIMKAIGASNFDIWKLFLAEAMIMGFIGGVGGIAIGYLGARGFNWGINALASAFGGKSLDLFQTPPWFLFTIIVFSAGVGIITGLWPAHRASKLSPIEALKNK